MKTNRSLRYHALCAALCLFASATCSGPTEPGLRYPDVPLDELRLYNFSVLRDSGLVLISGVPHDTNQILPPNDRLRLELSSSAGETESFDQSPIICNDETLACHGVDILLNDGWNVRDLFQLLNSIPARVYLTVFAGQGGSVFVFHPERVADAISQLKSQPAVKSAERWSYAADPPAKKWPLLGGLPLDFRPIVVNDGVVQAQPGDTITVRYYTKPDSNFVELRFTLPVP
jgi:hypothetical protein